MKSECNNMHGEWIKITVMYFHNWLSTTDRGGNRGAYQYSDYATEWTVRGLNPGMGKKFLSSPKL